MISDFPAQFLHKHLRRLSPPPHHVTKQDAQDQSGGERGDDISILGLVKAALLNESDQVPTKTGKWVEINIGYKPNLQKNIKWKNDPTYNRLCRHRAQKL
jgi:hypothetical protein